MIYRRATYEDLDKIWNKDIKENADDKRYIKWKKEFITANSKNDIITFVVLDNDDPVGQTSLILNSDCVKSPNKDILCNKESANMATFRIEKRFEGQGHISKLVKMAEDYARKLGYKYLTIGSEAKESRNLAIYLHWQYNQFIGFDINEGDLILYYRKNLSTK